MKWNIRFIIFCVVCVVTMGKVKAQMTYGQTGLLHMASADMQERGTVIVGTNYMNRHNLPPRWKRYNTFNYFFNFTPLPWLEIDYMCTLFHYFNKGKEYRGYYNTQDRNFGARLRLWKEGWGASWTPQVVVGVTDPFSDSTSDFEDIVTTVNGKKNGFFNRYYGAVSKHYSFENVGVVGAHVAYVHGNRVDDKWDGVQVGADFRVCKSGDDLGTKLLNGIHVMAEYDSRDVNVGFLYSTPWFAEFQLEVQDFQYVTAGVYFKIHLYK